VSNKSIVKNSQGGNLTHLRKLRNNLGNHLWFGTADSAWQLAAAPTHELRASNSLRTISRLQEEKKIVFQLSDTSKE
jgi:hypothetical protein